MSIQNILISQPKPANGSPYSDLISRYGVSVDFEPFFTVQQLTAREFRAQRIAILDYTAVVFTAKSTIDAFFKICEETRIAVPETMKYFCTTEAIALYLQKHIVYRKRKIFFGNGTLDSIIASIGTKHKGEQFLIATTDNCKQDIFKLFAKAKLKYQQAVFTKTVSSDLHSLDLSRYQLIVCYSPLDVKSLLENFPDFKAEGLKFATFGPATAKAVQDAGLPLEITAPSPECPSIAEALSQYLEKNR